MSHRGNSDRKCGVWGGLERVLLNTFCSFSSHILGPILPLKFPPRFQFTIFPDAFLHSSIGKGKGALSVWFAILEFADVFVPIALGIGALSVCFAILVFTYVFVRIALGIVALPVSPACLVFTVGIVPI